MGEWTRRFDEVGAADVATVGGKSANLGEMTRAGLAVPPGFCVTAGAYRAFLAESGGDRMIQEHLAGLAIDDPTAIDSTASAIRDWLTQCEMPAAIGAEIRAEYGQLSDAISAAGPAAADLAVAVRSSATAEDLPDASFAGQQDTYLNIRGQEAVLDHVRRCWASLWTARAVAYRIRQGYDHQAVALAVAVQAMVDADVAGVLFTADPVTNDRARMVINGSWGLGEAIVSGMVTPDTWTIRKPDGVVLTRQIGRKERTVVRLPDGGAEERPVPRERQEVPSLSDAELAELAEMGRRIEDHYGAPMDVEWAYSGGRCYLLQARPITTLAEPPAEFIAGDFNRSMFLEIFPDPLSPAFISVVEPLFAGMLHFTFRTLGFRPPAGVRAVAAFYGQPYFNQRYIEAAVAPLRPATRRSFVGQFVNPFGRHGRDASIEVSVPFLRMGWRLLRLMRTLHWLLPREVRRYRSAIAEVEGVDFTLLSDRELLERVDRLVFQSASRLLNYDFLLIMLIQLTYQALGTLLQRYLGERTEELRARLVSGVTGNVTMETNKRMWDLSRVAAGSDEVSTAIREAPSLGELRSAISASPAGRDFLAQLDQFLEEFGHREIRMDILYPTWGEDPAPVLAFVRGYLDVTDASSPHRQQQRLVRERTELVREVRQHVRRDSRGRLLVWPIFRWVLRHTQANTRERDTMHFELTRLFPPFRALLLELGRRWTERGLLSAADDIFFLTFDEMKATAADPQPRLQLVVDRRRGHEANQRRTPPAIIRDGVEADATDGLDEAGDGSLRGVAGSPGRVSGAVRIIRGPDEFERLRDGEILVAPLTNPVWTPLFAVAAGLVTEVGGILSHGAIVAREYGIPAVMAVGGATSRLRDGQWVTVDGARGVVRIEAMAEPENQIPAVATP